VTTAGSASSNETTLIGTLHLQAFMDAHVWRTAADRSTDGRSGAAAAADNPTMLNPTQPSGNGPSHFTLTALTTPILGYVPFTARRVRAVDDFPDVGRKRSSVNTPMARITDYLKRV
jgi:hypothetical protein